MSSLPQTDGPGRDAFGVPFYPVFSESYSMDAPRSWIVYWIGRRRHENGKYLLEKRALRGDFDFCAGLADSLLAAAAEGEPVDFVTIIPCTSRPGGATKSAYWLAVNTVHEFKRDSDMWRFWDLVLDTVGASMPDAFECAEERAKVE